MPIVSKTISHTYPYPFEQVVEGFYKRYPEKQTPEILGVKEVTRSIIDGEVHIKREYAVRNSLPSILRAIVSYDTVYALEDTIFNPKARTLHVSSVNSSFASILTCTETSVYKANPLKPNETLFTQYGTVHGSMFFGLLKSYFESFVADKVYKSGCQGPAKFENQLKEWFGEPS